MKKFLFFFSVVAFIACNSGDPKVKGAHGNDDSTSKANNTAEVTYPYEISYSSKFEMGDAQQSKMILELWKDFDNGDVSKHKEYFADSVEMLFPDGSRMYTSRDSAIAATNAYRAMYSAVTSRVDAVLPTKSLTDSVNWVAVWGMETHTMKGKTDSVDLHEVWRFNKNGKVDFMMQYDRKTPR